MTERKSNQELPQGHMKYYLKMVGWFRRNSAVPSHFWAGGGGAVLIYFLLLLGGRDDTSKSVIVTLSNLWGATAPCPPPPPPLGTTLRNRIDLRKTPERYSPDVAPQGEAPEQPLEITNQSSECYWKSYSSSANHDQWGWSLVSKSDESSWFPNWQCNSVRQNS